jgi:RNA recognition motif-containing protein
VHINNLSFKVTEEELKDFCETNFGETKKVHLVSDEHGRSKGFAFVEFANPDAMNSAVRAKEVQIKDRVAVINRSNRSITSNKESRDDSQ